jgi:A/G-specific adenine glycosylase
VPRNDHSQLARQIAAWFRRAARPLPWRVTPRDPYLSLVSEYMLQQTQVSRVLEKFEPFIARFPTLQDLAAASLDDVLAEWSGLGYYRRARHLHAAARMIVSQFDGTLPSRLSDLLRLPGVGRYTAGALASIVYNQPAPIVDGNVARVLLRIHAKQLPKDEGLAFSWEQAEHLAASTRDVAALNEGLMELGATVCTPANPRCDACPVASLCASRSRGLQNEIPAPAPRTQRLALHCSVLIVRDDRAGVLMEKRPASGLWAGMWQPPTLERVGARPTRAEIAAYFGAPSLKRLGSFIHRTTHRDITFVVYQAPAADDTGRRWVTPAQLAKLALGNAQRRALAYASSSK